VWRYAGPFRGHAQHLPGTMLGQFQAISSKSSEQCLANSRLLAASSSGLTPCREQQLVEMGRANSKPSADIWPTLGYWQCLLAKEVDPWEAIAAAAAAVNLTGPSEGIGSMSYEIGGPKQGHRQQLLRQMHRPTLGYR